MARELQGKFLVRRAADGDRLFENPHLLPTVTISISVRILRVRLIDIYVLLVGPEEEGQTESDRSIVPDGNARQNRFSSSNAVEAWPGQMHEIP